MRKYNRRQIIGMTTGALFGIPAFGEVLDEVKGYRGEPIILRLSHFAPATHPIIAGPTQEWVNNIESETEGRIRFKTYYGATLHGAADGFKAATSDIVDITPSYISYQPSSFRLMHVLNLPFAFPTAPVGALISEELYPLFFREEFERMGVYLHNIHANGSYNIFTKKKVENLGDLKGMKIRSPGGTGSDTLKALGAVPVSMPTPEVYSAYQRGVVDGVFIFNSGATAYRVDELSKYMFKIEALRVSLAWSWNKKAWDNLPEIVRRYMYVKSRELSINSAIGFDKFDREAEMGFSKTGIEIIIPKEETREAMHEAVDPLWGKFVEDNSKAGDADGVVHALRERVEKYAEWNGNMILSEIQKNPVSGIIDGI